MPRFNDSEAKVFEVQPEGDYILRVIGFEIGISKRGNTAGSENYEIEFQIETKSGRVWETLIDHELTAWKIDLFLKSADVALAKGEAFEFDKERAKANRVTYVNPWGLRCWARLIVDDYNGKKRNKVSVFYTDKQKLAPVRPVEAEPAAVPAGAPAVAADNEDDIPF